MASWRQAADAMRDVLVPALNDSLIPPTRTFVGWPDPNTILGDLRSNGPGAIVSIYPHAGAASTARYPLGTTTTKQDATEVVTINGLSATFSGTVTPGDNIFLYLNNKHGFGVHCKVESTLDSLAADMAAAIRNSPFDYGADSVGPTVNVGGGLTLITAFAGRAFGFGVATSEVGRITRRIQVSIWAANPDDRANIEDKVIVTLDTQEFLIYADDSYGRIQFDSAMTHDTAMVANIFKSDVFYSVEYGVYSAQVLGRVGDIFLEIDTYDLLGNPQFGTSREVF